MITHATRSGERKVMQIDIAPITPTIGAFQSGNNDLSVYCQLILIE